MRLFIAEKPSLGRAIAEGIGVTAKYDTYIDCKDDTRVTWCFGHMLELLKPEEYSEKWKSWQELPVIPKVWKKKPMDSCIRQLDVISKQLAKCDAVVNAGDPDREGQLIVDEVLDFCGWNGRTERIWLAALDPRSVKKALGSIKDNEGYAPLRNAATARSQADWLIGMNATRAMTNLGRKSGISHVLSMGRVQTPVLALVVNRDRTIKNFRPQEYLVLEALFHHGHGDFKARFVPSDSMQGLDSEGRLTDKAQAQIITDAVKGENGTVVEVRREDKSKNPPLPFNLSVLQKTASARFGMTAQKVLSTCQSLYEKKLTTYPRTDCQYLPEEQFQDAPRILSSLATIPDYGSAVEGADPKLKSKAWNTSKITAHHAIIPTGETPGSLNADEEKVFDLIATGYLLQFYPPLRFTATRIAVAVSDTRWEATGRVVTEEGWTRIVSEDNDEDKENDGQRLPEVAKDDTVECLDVAQQKKKTTPPPHFSEGTLIEAMSNIHRFIDDAEAKKVLKENEGIGTEATRAEIIEKLKKVGYLVPKGKQILASELAFQVIDLSPSGLTDPVTTARWETRLTSISKGRGDVDTFMHDQIDTLPAILGEIMDSDKEIKPTGKIHSCPKCGKPLERIKGKFGYFWSCRRKELHDDGNYVSLPDVKGAPGKKGNREVSETVFLCEDCQRNLVFVKGTTRDGRDYEYFHCPGCDKKFENQDGKPVEKKKRSSQSDTDFKCDKCDKPLVLVRYTADDGSTREFFRCTNEKCKATYNCTDGRPVARAKAEKTSYKCPKCKKPLVKREFTSKKNGTKYFMFCCTGYPDCKESFFEDRDGKPNFDYQRKK